jgi:hypothetical protein
MFSRKSKAERTAGQAWDYLSSAMAAAADSAREAGKYTADVTSGKASDFAELAGQQRAKLADAGKGARKDAGKKGRKLAKQATKKSQKLTGKAEKVGGEAWSRANAAADALAGRNKGLPWGTILGFSLIGVGLGWAAATAGRAALERQAEVEERELAETATIVTPN